MTSGAAEEALAASGPSRRGGRGPASWHGPDKSDEASARARMPGPEWIRRRVTRGDGCPARRCAARARAWGGSRARSGVGAVRERALGEKRCRSSVGLGGSGPRSRSRCRVGTASGEERRRRARAGWEPTQVEGGCRAERALSATRRRVGADAAGGWRRARTGPGGNRRRVRTRRPRTDPSHPGADRPRPPYRRRSTRRNPLSTACGQLRLMWTTLSSVSQPPAEAGMLGPLAVR